MAQGKNDLHFKKLNSNKIENSSNCIEIHLVVLPLFKYIRN